MRTPALLALASLLLATPSPAALFSWSAVDCDGVPVAGTSSPAPIVSLFADAWYCAVDDSLEHARITVGGTVERGRVTALIDALDYESEAVYGSPDSVQLDPSTGALILEMRFDDFVVSGPPARGPAMVDAALRLELSGELQAREFDGDSYSALEIEVEMDGAVQQGRAEFWHSEVQGRYGPYEEGFLVGTLVGTSSTSASLGTVITTAPASLPVGEAFTLRVTIRMEASAWDPFARVGARVSSIDGIGFPSSGVVLELPDGYSADSAEAGVSGNSWSVSVGTKQLSWGSFKQAP